MGGLRVPSWTTVPVSGRSMPAIMRSKVVLPAPDGAITHRRAPARNMQVGVAQERARGICAVVAGESLDDETAGGWHAL